MASGSTFAAKSNSQEFLKLPRVVVHKELHSLLRCVKELELVTTYEEVLDGLGKYICEKQLFDKNNPCKVFCKNDELGTILGIEEFTVPDLKTLIHKIVVPVEKMCKDSSEAATFQSNQLKRKLEGSLEDCDPRKMVAVDVALHSPLILHIPPSPTYSDGCESVNSVQGYETAFVKDTSDEYPSPERESILAIEETYNIEYEVESDSSSTLNADTSDAEEDEKSPEALVFINAAIMTFFSKHESDIEFFADDSSDYDSSIDAEISKSDFWNCKKCDTANQPPNRYCLKCFNERLNWLPDHKPLRKRKKKSRKSAAATDKDTNEAGCSKSDPSSQEWSTVGCDTQESTSAISSNVDSASTSFSSCADTYLSMGALSLNYLHSAAEPMASSYFKPVSPYCGESGPLTMEPISSSMQSSSGIESLGPSSVESACSSSMEPSSSSLNSPYDSSSLGSYNEESPCSSYMEHSGSGWKSPPNAEFSAGGGGSSSEPSSSSETKPKMCMICCSRPAGASIIHGIFAHQISCYKCARKLQKEKKGCPICRRTIEKVVHVIGM